MTGVGGEVSTVLLERLRQRLGLSSRPALTRRWVGATSTVYRWGDTMAVKIPHDEPSAVAACLRHVDVLVAVRAMGVLAPAVLLVDNSLGVPVIVSELARGRSLRAEEVTARVWHEVGEQLAVLHAATPAQVPDGLRRVQPDAVPDPLQGIQALASRGAISTAVSDLLMQERNRLARTGPDPTLVFCHGDMHAGNVIAKADRLTGLIDYAGAGWLEAAWDFVGTPVHAVAPMMAGYRQGGRDERIDGRIAWCRLHMKVQEWTHQQTVPDTSVAEAISALRTVAA